MRTRLGTSCTAHNGCAASSALGLFPSTVSRKVVETTAKQLHRVDTESGEDPLPESQLLEKTITETSLADCIAIGR